MPPHPKSKRMPAIVQLALFLLLFCLLSYFLVGGYFWLKGIPAWKIWLPSTWEDVLLPFFKTNLIWDIFIGIFLALFTDFLSSLIFPGYENEILSWSRQIFKAVKKTDKTVTRIEHTQGEQGEDIKAMRAIIEAMAKRQGVSVAEVVQTNARIREDSKKVPVESISKELQAEIDTYLSEFRYAEARTAIDGFLSQYEQKDLAKLHYQKALTYEAEINYPKAKEELEIAVALDKENPVILHQYGSTLKTMGDYDKAIGYTDGQLRQSHRILREGADDITKGTWC